MHPGALDGATGDEAAAISQQHNLEHHPRVVGVGSGFIVAKTRIELAQIEFVVHQMIERELEGTGWICSLSTMGRKRGLRSTGL